MTKYKKHTNNHQRKTVTNICSQFNNKNGVLAAMMSLSTNRVICKQHIEAEIPSFDMESAV